MEKVKNRNILFIVPRLPEYDRASGDLRCYRTFKILQEQYNIIVYNDRVWDRFLRNGDTRYLDEMKREGIQVIQSIDELTPFLRSDNLHAVVCQFYMMAVKYQGIIRQHAPTVPIIIDSVDVNYHRERMLAEISKDDLLIAKSEQTKLAELRAYKNADFVWVISLYDQDILAKENLSRDKMFIVPNIHVLSESIPRRNERDSDLLLFVGAFLHRPNVDAMKYFCSEVMPLILREMPQIKLKIVGDSPPDEIKNLASDNIEITGFVPVTKPYLDSAMVSVAPLRAGAGLKGKVGEALAEGLPVVTTYVGAQGLDLTSGQDCFIANEPSTFANNVIQLLWDENLWYQFSAKGREFMQKHFSYDTIKQDLIVFFKNLKRREIVKPKVSVVYLTKNAGSKFEESLKAVFSQKVSFPFEVVIVDSGSTDNTLKVIKEHQVQLFQIAPHEFNFGITRDYGFQVSMGEIVIAISQDAIPVGNDWLEKLVAPFDDPRIDIVQGTAILPESDNLFYWEKVNLFYYTRECRRWGAEHKGIGLSFVCCAIRRSVWEKNKIGYTLISEDKVFQKKMSEVGATIIKQHTAKCYHAHTYTIPELIKRCKNEGLGMKGVGNIYTFREMIKDLFNIQIIRTLINGIKDGEVKRLAELFFPIIRPIFVYMGNHLTKKYVS